tara:strand:+ start:5542 stop:6120 length:579 start_codon:yes stop_codon:yes gene_type:complete
MKPIEATFDEATDGSSPIMPGTYPAHVVTLVTREFDSGSTVFNMTFKIADDAKDTKIIKQHKNGSGTYEAVLDEKGQPIEMSAGYMSGKTFYANGVWLTPEPEKGQGWKNRKYLESFSNLGIDFPRNDDGVVSLAEVEEDDVLGRPAVVRLTENEYTNRNGEQRTAFKVDSILPWESGKRLSADEIADDVPF